MIALEIFYSTDILYILYIISVDFCVMIYKNNDTLTITYILLNRYVIMHVTRKKSALSFACSLCYGMAGLKQL